MIKKIKFFQERDIPPESYVLLAQALQYEFGKRGEVVFEKGSIGDKFYIILSGKVGIYVPRQKKETILKMETMSKADRKSLRNSIASSKKFNSILPYHTMKKIENMTEFIVLDDGKAFGEAALINDAPRGATILCKTDCHFAIMNKENFTNTLLAIEQKTQNKFVNFLKSLKMFTGWTHRKCEKLLHAIENKKTEKNQHVIIENEKADCFYIVFEGEFEITKNLSLVPKQKIDARRYFDKRDKSDFKSYYHTVVKTFSNMNTFNREVPIKFIGPGQIFGLEDSITRKDDLRYYSYSVVCRSATGLVLGFSRMNTFTKLAFNENTWKYLQQTAKDTVERLNNMEKKSRQRLKLITNQRKYNLFKLKNLNAVEEMIEDEMKDHHHNSKEAFRQLDMIRNTGVNNMKHTRSPSAMNTISQFESGTNKTHLSDLKSNKSIPYTTLSRPFSNPPPSRRLNNTFYLPPASNHSKETLQYNSAQSAMRAASKASIRKIQKIRKEEMEKSRMLNTFIPRPSYSRWVVEKQERPVYHDTGDETESSEESDYYGSESEKEIINRPKANIKFGRLSTLKEKLVLPNNMIERLDTRRSQGRIYMSKKDIIEEADSELNSDMSTVLNAKFDDAPPLVVTKSIEINKSGLRHYKDNDLEGQRAPRMLKTPALDTAQARRDKVRKIPDPKDISKTTTVKKQEKVELNPRMSKLKKIAPALGPSMMNMIKNRNRMNNTSPMCYLKTEFTRGRFKSPVPKSKGRIRGLMIAGGLFSPPNRLRPKKLF